MFIRQETRQDYQEIFQLIKDAFKNAEHADGHEQDLAAALRNSPAFVPELSLVAEINGKLAGHIMFSEATVGGDTVLVLAPLSVSPEFQLQGIGTALMKEAHRIAKELGYPYSLVLGSEWYYPRVGYVPAEPLGVKVPPGMPSANFMLMKLQANAKPISGAVAYAKEFGL